MRRFLNYSGAEPAEDLALEEALQAGIEDGSSASTWRVWEAARPAVVLGTGQKAADEVKLTAAEHCGVPVLRRHSGGGAVLIGPGIIQYSAFLRYEELTGSETITGAMLGALAPVRRALNKLGVEVKYAGLSDLAVPVAGELKKLAGNAQARKRKSVLVHGTLLADPDWELPVKLLRFPSKPPDYRGKRDHRSFLVSLRELKVSSTTAAFREALREVLRKEAESREEEPWAISEPLPEELRRAEKLYREKYGTTAWNLRR